MNLPKNFAAVSEQIVERLKKRGIVGHENQMAYLKALIAPHCGGSELAALIKMVEAPETVLGWVIADEQRPTKKRTIEPEYRTIPMTFRRAAKLMGKGNSKDAAEWLSKSAADGSISAESVTRQTHVFDRRDFPAEVWPNITPA